MRVMYSLFMYARAVHSIQMEVPYSLKRGNIGYICSTAIVVGVKLCVETNEEVVCHYITKT